MFGFSPFRYKNVRRKDDARDYPSRIEFGVKRGIALPLALNNGQHVEFLLARIAGAYATLSSFDELPTPFRAVAVDLVTAQQVILDTGIAGDGDARHDVAARHLSSRASATAGCSSTAGR